MGQAMSAADTESRAKGLTASKRKVNSNGPPQLQPRGTIRRCDGGPYRDRTYDLGIKSPLLYQLS